MHLDINKKVSILGLEHPYERHARQVLFILLALLVCAYLYFVAASVLNVIARKEALADADRLQGSIGAYENQYFALSAALTQQAGIALGLEPIAKPSYVSRPGNVGDAGGDSHAI